ncbi:hypothetical protein ACVGW2_00270, partial [Enterobacter intestinihominis]
GNHLIQTETGATVARRGFYMFSIIYHAGAAVLFLVMSLAGGAARHHLIQQKKKQKKNNKNLLMIISKKLNITSKLIKKKKKTTHKNIKILLPFNFNKTRAALRSLRVFFGGLFFFYKIFFLFCWV